MFIVANRTVGAFQGLICVSFSYGFATAVWIKQFGSPSGGKEKLELCGEHVWRFVREGK